MKLLANGCVIMCLKISQKVGSNIQQFAGGPRPLGKKKAADEGHG